MDLKKVPVKQEGLYFITRFALLILFLGKNFLFFFALPSFVIPSFLARVSLFLFLFLSGIAFPPSSPGGSLVSLTPIAMVHRRERVHI